MAENHTVSFSFQSKLQSDSGLNWRSELSPKVNVELPAQSAADSWLRTCRARRGLRYLLCLQKRRQPIPAAIIAHVEGSGTGEKPPTCATEAALAGKTGAKNALAEPTYRFVPF